MVIEIRVYEDDKLTDIKETITDLSLEFTNGEVIDLQIKRLSDKLKRKYINSQWVGDLKLRSR